MLKHKKNKSAVAKDGFLEMGFREPRRINNITVDL